MSHTVMKDPKGVISERFTQESSGARWKSRSDQRGKRASRTRGTEKPNKASMFDRYCATRSRAQYHINYMNFVEKCRKAN